MKGQAIFNVLIILLGALSELLPSFKDWWDNSEWRDFIFLGACLALAGVFLGICAVGVAVENCTLPIGWDDVGAAVGAAFDALGLFLAARLFVRGGLYGARRVRVVLWSR